MWALQRIHGSAFHPHLTTSRWLHSSSSRSSAISLPLFQAHDLLDTLSKPNFVTRRSSRQTYPTFTPTTVWDRYTELVHEKGSENISREVHQQVLRHCVPSEKLLRWRTSREFVARPAWAKPYVYEVRLQTVVRNMDRAGYMPSLDDYHFILGQFAAVGHYMGSRDVLREMIRTEMDLTPKTFGLCLQSIAYRLAQPQKRRNREGLLKWTKGVMDEVLQEMYTRKVPFTSVNMDLTLRILRDSMDLNGFENLLRVSYGVDLANPDRLALEHSGQVGSSGASDLIPFSTATLNTTLETLGRLAPVSRLVAAFEVLTTPLPTNNSQISFALEEDDDDFGVPPDPQTSPSLPHAEPNTKSYNILLKYLLAAHNKTLLRHYMLQAMYIDHKKDREIRGLISYGLPFEEIPSHNLAVNAGMLRAVYQQSVARRSRQLKHFVLKACNRVLRRKMFQAQYYSDLLKKVQAQAEAEAASVTSSNNSDAVLDTVSPKGRDEAFTAIFDVDLDAAPLNSAPKSRKYLHLPTHLSILERDTQQIRALAHKVETGLRRYTSTFKKRLGRRVMKGKDTYVSSVGKRVVLSRAAWKDQVNNRRRESLYVHVKRGEEIQSSSASAVVSSATSN